VLLVNLLAALNFANVFLKIKNVWKIKIVKKRKNVTKIKNVVGWAEVLQFLVGWIWWVGCTIAKVLKVETYKRFFTSTA